jgi:DeoR family glycerol-3-phosphate regulon repressor
MAAAKKNRREVIVELTRQHRHVSVEVLAGQLGVSAQTIRRDINKLCEQNILRRRHGGAELFERQLNTPYDERTTTNSEAKHAIAGVAASLVPDDSTVFISVGTTPAMVAEALKFRKGLTVVTNNLNAAMALAHEPTNRIILPGGELRLPDRDILGDHVVDLVTAYRAEFAIFGVGGVAADGSLLDFHRSEVRLREAMREGCQQALLVVDHSKFGRFAPAVGGHLSQMDRIIMDRKPDGTFAAVLEPVLDRVLFVGDRSA